MQQRTLITCKWSVYFGVVVVVAHIYFSSLDWFRSQVWVKCAIVSMSFEMSDELVWHRQSAIFETQIERFNVTFVFMSQNGINDDAQMKPFVACAHGLHHHQIIQQKLYEYCVNQWRSRYFVEMLHPLSFSLSIIHTEANFQLKYNDYISDLFCYYPIYSIGVFVGFRFDSLDHRVSEFKLKKNSKNQAAYAYTTSASRVAVLCHLWWWR